MKPVILCILLFGLPVCAWAQLFTTNVTSGADSFSASFNNIDDAFDQLTTARLKDEIPSYDDPVSTMNAVINYRGVPMNFAFSTSNSTELTLEIPSLGISESFVGATRDESKELLIDYLEGAGSSTVDRLQKELARVSGIDPVAGNPDSLMGSMVSHDFDMAIMDMATTEVLATPGGAQLLQNAFGRLFRADKTGSDMSGGGVGIRSDEGSGAGASGQGESTEGQVVMPDDALSGSSGGRIGVDVSYAKYEVNGNETDTQTLVIDYLYQFEDPLKILRLSLPIARSDTEGAETYKVNAGVAFSYPVSRSWSLTPGVSYGVGGSEDLGGGASINGVSLASGYRLIYGNYLYKIGNMIARYQTGSVSLGDYEVNPGISNTVFRNGLMVLRPTLMMDIPAMVQLFIVDTRFSGDELFTEHYLELGFALGILTDDELLAEDNFHMGFTYLNSQDSDIEGYKLNFGFDF